MAFILSLQGSPAVGKTTALQYVQAHAPYIHISYELDTEMQNIFEEIKRLQLNRAILCDYMTISKLLINNEITRWNKVQSYPCTIMDNGAELIEFHMLHYPLSIGEKWDIETLMAEELYNLRKCMPYRILFLEAEINTIRTHNENDIIRERKFFENYVTRLLPLQKEWFFNKDYVDILNVDGYSKEEVGSCVLEWINRIMKNG